MFGAKLNDVSSSFAKLAGNLRRGAAEQVSRIHKSVKQALGKRFQWTQAEVQFGLTNRMTGEE